MMCYLLGGGVNEPSLLTRNAKELAVYQAEDLTGRQYAMYRNIHGGCLAFL